MPQMLRLSQGHWLNLDVIVEVCEQHAMLVVVCTPTIPDENGTLSPYNLYLMGEERERLLAWLNHTGPVIYTRPASSDTEPPF
jgi:hypothetical protein